MPKVGLRNIYNHISGRRLLIDAAGLKDAAPEF